ncbi:hypothetical protein OZX61_07395 [Acinetobacter sp. ESL0695]|uniref:hypothetical protein n=1 Tax=Acinetobacter sp. ESL0695 TaxID=2983215 RepID=UPI0023F4FC61|nr:hypothetical protein [Acinetobacter sp. ESL0695]WEV48114.1 hypothetical protein OZX61_07395 [Acinetobacter sp. ESL0695]
MQQYKITIVEIDKDSLNEKQPKVEKYAFCEPSQEEWVEIKSYQEGNIPLANFTSYIILDGEKLYRNSNKYYESSNGEIYTVVN